MKLSTFMFAFVLTCESAFVFSQAKADQILANAIPKKVSPLAPSRSLKMAC